MGELEKLNTEDSDYEGWEEIGYHRVMAGLYYYIIFAIFGIATGLIVPMIVPFAESLGYYNILTSIFGTVFTFADLGIARALNRYASEFRITDPDKAVQYISFFIFLNLLLIVST